GRAHRGGCTRLPGGAGPARHGVRHTVPTGDDRGALPSKRREDPGRRGQGHELLMALRDFLLPDLGEGLEDAEVVTWRVAEGDRIELNQALVEVNTAKALVEIPAPWQGVVEKLHGAEGDVVKVGEPLVTVRVDDEGATAEGG